MVLSWITLVVGAVVTPFAPQFGVPMMAGSIQNIARGDHDTASVGYDSSVSNDRSSAPPSSPPPQQTTPSPQADPKPQPTQNNSTPASQQRVPVNMQQDYNIIANHRDDIAKAANEAGVDPAFLAGIISRESNAGRTLDSTGHGDHGNAFGVAQVDCRHHKVTGTHDPWSVEHLKQAAQIAAKCETDVAAKHPNWTPELKHQGAAAAYNSGVSNVQTAERIDAGTTGNNYGKDVLSRQEVLSPIFNPTDKE